MKLNLKKVLAGIKPSLGEEKLVKETYNEFAKKTKNDLKKHKANLVLGGSIGKGTWLKADHDIDAFVQFPYDEGVSDKLEKLLKKNFKAVERIHGSRDYFRLKLNGFSIEAVPVLKIRKISGAKNVTDCSVFHIKWVNKKLSKKMKDEARLIKQFCKSCKVYGAETYIKGFSGYVIEILTFYFKSFNGFVKGVARLREGIVIDISRHKKALDRNKLSPIILIDPVQGDRNAAAALSKEKFERIKEICKSYLKKPSYDYFAIKKKDVDKLVKRFDVVVEAIGLEGKDDVIGTKILKVFEFIKERLNKEGFRVGFADWVFDEPSYLWFNAENKEVSKEYMHHGPPVAIKEHAEKFKERYKGYKMFEKNGRVCVVLPRENYKLENFVDSVLKDEYVKERVKAVRRVK